MRDAEIKTLQGEFENLVPQAAAFASEGKNPFGFYFIDPTGWTGYPMSKLRPLFSNRYSELLINFMTRSQSHDEVHTRGASLPVVRVREKKIPLCPNLVCNVRF